MAGNDLIMSRADAAVLSRDFSLATRLYNSLLAQSPDDIFLLEKLGSIYIKSGNDKKALEYFLKVNELKPNDFKTLNSLGGIYRRLKIYDKSIEVLREALRLNINIAEVNYNLGFTYKFMEQYDEAVECFETVIQMNPSDVLAYNHLGSIYHKRSEYQKAIQTYLKGLKVDCNHPILHLNLAKSYEKENETKNAMAEYEAALRSKPGWKDAIYDYAKLLVKLNQTQYAKELISQAIELNPRDEKMHTKKGEIALKLDPTYKRALVGLAQSLEENGDSVNAVEYIEKAEKENPEDVSLIKKSASISLSANKMLSASKKIKALLDQDKEDVEALDLAGQFFIVKNQVPKAENCYKQIEQLDPSYIKYLAQASKRFKQKGNLEQAEKYIKQYIVKSPKDSKALTNLALIAEALGKTNEALVNFRKALQIDSNNVYAKNALARISEYLTASEEESLLQNSEEENESTQNELENENVQDAQIELEEEPILVDEETSPTETDLWKSESWDPDSIVEESDDPFAAMDEQDESILTGTQNETPESTLDDLEEEIENEENKGFSVPPLESMVDYPRQSNDDDNGESKKQVNPEDDFDDDDLFGDLADFDSSDNDKENNSTENPLDSNENVDTKDESLSALDDDDDDFSLPLDDFEKPTKQKSKMPQMPKMQEPDFDDDFMPKSNSDLYNTPDFDSEFEDFPQENYNQIPPQPQQKRQPQMPQMQRPEPVPQSPLSASDAIQLMESVIKTQSDASRAMEAAAKAQLAAEKAQDSVQVVQDAESSLTDMATREVMKAAEQLREQAEEIAKEATDKVIAEKMQILDDVIPSFEKMLAEKTEFKKQDETQEENSQFTQALLLFQSLKSLGQSLPEEARTNFMQSSNRLKIDYIISRLSGNEGLLKKSQELRDSGVLENFVKEAEVPLSYTGKKLARTVLLDLLELSKNLTDKDLLVSIDKIILDVQEKL